MFTPVAIIAQIIAALARLSLFKKDVCRFILCDDSDILSIIRVDFYRSLKKILCNKKLNYNTLTKNPLGSSIPDSHISRISPDSTVLFGKI